MFGAGFAFFIEKAKVEIEISRDNARKSKILRDYTGLN